MSCSYYILNPCGAGTWLAFQKSELSPNSWPVSTRYPMSEAALGQAGLKIPSEDKNLDLSFTSQRSPARLCDTHLSWRLGVPPSHSVLSLSLGLKLILVCWVLQRQVPVSSSLGFLAYCFLPFKLCSIVDIREEGGW